jgi:hypothetical protein
MPTMMLSHENGVHEKLDMHNIIDLLKSLHLKAKFWKLALQLHVCSFVWMMVGLLMLSMQKS